MPIGKLHVGKLMLLQISHFASDRVVDDGYRHINRPGNSNLVSEFNSEMFKKFGRDGQYRTKILKKLDLM